MKGADTLSSAASALVSKYRVYVGKWVVVSAPRYKAADHQSTDRQITGEVLGLAWRENGRHAGTIFDMVIRTDTGVLRTIALSRITDIRTTDAPEAAQEGQST